MCDSNSLTMLATCPQGYVATCDGCGRISVVFENIYLLLSEGELINLNTQLVKKINAFKMETYVGNKKKIMFQTPFSNVYFCFTENEYVALQKLTTAALTQHHQKQYLSFLN